VSLGGGWWRPEAILTCDSLRLSRPVSALKVLFAWRGRILRNCSFAPGNLNAACSLVPGKLLVLYSNPGEM
jgi:hypothetical protein